MVARGQAGKAVQAAPQPSAPKGDRERPICDPTLRSLLHLQETGSTARVLNLPAVWRKHSGQPQYWDQPLFGDPMLNKAFVIKHMLRGSETDLFHGLRSLATKVLVPMDHTNLKIGGRYLFVRQRGYDALVADLFGQGSRTEERDRRVLDALDQVPSLDPFLLREQLRRLELDVAPCYFDVSEADMERMLAFVVDEMKPLISVAFGEAEFAEHAESFAKKLLSTEIDTELVQLRATLKLGERDYAEGMFCWKGFLYYKWQLRETIPAVRGVLDQLGDLVPPGVAHSDRAKLLSSACRSVKRAIVQNINTVKVTLGVYDDAYEKLTREGRAQAFKEFLMDAPHLFKILGESLSALNHIHSFWSFRFPSGTVAGATVDELLDILSDFQAGLSGQAPPKDTPAAHLAKL